MFFITAFGCTYLSFSFWVSTSSSWLLYLHLIKILLISCSSWHFLNRLFFFLLFFIDVIKVFALLISSLLRVFLLWLISAVIFILDIIYQWADVLAKCHFDLVIHRAYLLLIILYVLQYVILIAHDVQLSVNSDTGCSGLLVLLTEIYHRIFWLRLHPVLNSDIWLLYSPEYVITHYLSSIWPRWVLIGHLSYLFQFSHLYLVLWPICLRKIVETYYFLPITFYQTVSLLLITLFLRSHSHIWN